ncbi:hypothetical protein MNBD_GAMMA11-2592 [hydrothermal vent metagenome]|uniref:Uncharacterized protein n=1 Tax=hydrothermal vent metagenome TaxID=652676 RepID=A0A3B0WWF4_9ZZZZ
MVKQVRLIDSGWVDELPVKICQLVPGHMKWVSISTGL